MGADKPRPPHVFVRLQFTLETEDQYEYFKSCARIRGISTQALMNRLMKTIADDCMVRAILDDDSVCERRPYELPYSEERYEAWLVRRGTKS